MENSNDQIQQLADKYSKDLKLFAIAKGLKNSKSQRSKDYFFYLRKLRNDYPEVYKLYIFFCKEDLVKKEEFPIVYASEKVTMSLQACYASNQN